MLTDSDLIRLAQNIAEGLPVELPSFDELWALAEASDDPIIIELGMKMGDALFCCGKIDPRLIQVEAVDVTSDVREIDQQIAALEAARDRLDDEIGSLSIERNRICALAGQVKVTVAA